MTKETKRTSSSSRAITTRMGPATQGTKTAVTPRDPRWRKWESSLLPLPQVDWSWPQTISVPIRMLPTPTPDQAHRSRRAAWGTQLPPSSLHSTPTRRIGTELRRTPSMHCRGAAGRLPLSAGAWDGPWECTVQPRSQMSGSRVPPLFTDWGSGFHVVAVWS